MIRFTRSLDLIVASLLFAVCLSLGMAAQLHASESDQALQKAFQREYALLLAEKNALTQQLAESKRALTAARREQSQQLERQQSLQLKLSQQSETLSQLWDDINLNPDQSLESNLIANLDGLVQQATQSLGSYGALVKAAGFKDESQTESKDESKAESKIGTPSKTDIDQSIAVSGAKLESVFARAQAYMREASQIRAKTEPFFNDAGQSVRHQVIRIGAIARSAQQGSQHLALIPTEGGASVETSQAGGLGEGVDQSDRPGWRAWANPDAFQLSGYADWKSPLDSMNSKHSKGSENSEDSKDSNQAAVGLFVFEPAQRFADARPEKGWWDTVQGGGHLAWVIVCLGAVAGLLSILRLTLLKSSAKTPLSFVSEIEKLLQKGELEEAKQWTKKRPGALARVASSTLDHLNEPTEQQQHAINATILAESVHLDRFATLITVSAAVAPLLGLLGTVTGMIGTFDVITEVGTGDPRQLSGGISEALVTTMLGLMVAIPTLFAGQMLSTWAERIKHNMDQAALRILSCFHRVRSAHPLTHQTEARVDI